MNKYRIILLIVFICVFVLLDIVKIKVVNNDLELLGKIIYLDPGHGGIDPGAIYGNIYESDINLEISKKLKEKLEKNGASVYMTRTKNVDLSSPKVKYRKKSDLLNRARMIDQSTPDLYLSIHLNSSTDSSWNGAQVFYDDINPNNKTLAYIIQNQFKKDLNTDKEIKKIKDLYMYKNTKTTGVLVEVGYISNPIERNKLRTSSYQDKIVKSLVTSIINYFNEL